ncbi:unnamed protein product [Thelazia callipaeda]|uniref:protein-tyrosine-phosphatase n=1 Tax=Thelazia callipaeda TaxID=103827 RepID=A0A0N5D6G0_THECL|nr:unnamed protein product [Thelazia callipaeda]
MAREPFSLASVLHEQVAEIIPGKLYFCILQNRPISDSSIDYYFVDDEVHYDNFYSDFGPLNLSDTHETRCIVVCCGSANECIVNAAYLVGSYGILYLGMTAEIAYLKVHKAEPNGFIGFRDAAMGPATYRLHLHNVLRSVEKAVKFNWITFDDFDPDEYEYYEKVENGDLNWIIPAKILSFCGPHNQSVVENGYPYHAPEVYFDYFRSHNISTIIRLNKRMYEAKRFLDAGFEHIDLFFVDGSVPSDEIVKRFINVVDNAKGGVAVHCKAGLGRTGTLIACWLMKEYGVTAAESMAWLRICRPGSVIGPQQEFLIAKQPWCWALSSKSTTSHVLHLTDKVNEIRIEDTSNKVMVVPKLRPSSLNEINEREDAEKESNEERMTPSQGDHLLAQKAKAQWTMISHAKFTSPTTPVKPLSTMSTARRLLHCIGDISTPPPISRITVSATTSTANDKPLTKSKSTRKLALMRSKPYQCPGVKVHLPASVYELRPRNNGKTYGVLHFDDPAQELAPNAVALIGITARRNLNGIMK